MAESTSSCSNILQIYSPMMSEMNCLILTSAMIKGTQKPEVSLETKLEHFRIQKSSFPCMKSSPWIYSDR